MDKIRLDLKEYCQGCPYIGLRAEKEGNTLYAGDQIEQVESEIRVFCEYENLCKRMIKIKGEGNGR